MDISGMDIVSVDDNKNNLLIIEAYAQILGAHVKKFYTSPRSTRVFANTLLRYAHNRLYDA